MVLLIPRISPQDTIQRHKDVKGKGKRRVRPPPQIFHPENSGQRFEQLDETHIKFQGNIFVDGLMKLKISINKLRHSTPTILELEVFRRSSALDRDLVVRTLTECNVAMLKAGCRVRIIKGQQTGLIGKVHDVSEDIIIINTGERHSNIMFSDVRSHFSPGDYILVKAGENTGKVGTVTKVERKPDTDLVTFVNDMSVMTKRPKEVSSTIL